MLKLFVGCDLQGEADPNIPTFDNNTALHLAVGRNQVGMAALLITAGADPEAENIDPVDGRDEEPATAQDQLALGTTEEHEARGTTPMDLAAGNEKVFQNKISVDKAVSRYSC